MARPLKFNNPDDVWKLYIDYCSDLKNQSMFRPELIKSGERAGEVIQVEITVPATVLGFCIFADIDKQTYYNYVNNSEDVDNNRKEFFDIFTRVDDDIKNKQITGATVNLYNQAIVARLNGLNETINIGTNENQSINITIGDKLLDLKK